MKMIMTIKMIMKMMINDGGDENVVPYNSILTEYTGCSEEDGTDVGDLSRYMRQQ